MLYLKMIQRLQKERYFIFSPWDLLILFPGKNRKTLQNQLTEWVKRKYVVRLKRDLYELADKGSEDAAIPDLYIANRLYAPSYVSLETALSVYSLIPEVAAQATSVTTKPTREFTNKYGRFFYRSCQKKAFTGYSLMRYEGVKVCIADREKAIVDFVYFAGRRAGILDFKEERFNKSAFKKINWNKALKYSELFNKKTMSAVKKLKGWAEC